MQLLASVPKDVAWLVCTGEIIVHEFAFENSLELNKADSWLAFFLKIVLYKAAVVQF